MKDLFSAQSSQYRSYRPGYPAALIDYIVSFVPEKNIAWDCATGNGQAAVLLAPHFKKIIATDISAAQLSKAYPVPNIEYLHCPAEHTFIESESIDLITVAQAYHWLDWGAFHAEAVRVSRNNAVIALWLYDRFITENGSLNQLMDHFYENITGPYWDARRKHVDDHYENLPFPFERLPTRDFSYQTVWTSEQIKGYLSSWSAVQEYINVHHQSPVSLIEKDIDHQVPENVSVTFPVYLHIGRIKK